MPKKRASVPSDSSDSEEDGDAADLAPRLNPAAAAKKPVAKKAKKAGTGTDAAGPAGQRRCYFEKSKLDIVFPKKIPNNLGNA